MEMTHQELGALYQRIPELVTIDETRLETLGAELAAEEFSVPSWRFPGYPEADKDFLPFTFWTSAINFCFTDPDDGRKFARPPLPGKERPRTGSVGLIVALNDALQSGIPLLDPEYLAHELTLERLKKIFWSSAGPLPLLPERLVFLQNLGQVLLTRFDGKYEHVFEEADWDTGELIALVKQAFVAFQDDELRCFEHPSESGIVFDKRARLLPLIYQGRALDSNEIPTLKNIEVVGPVMDYIIPRFLREPNVGVLVYSDELAELVDTGTFLKAWGAEEFAIRFTATQAVRDLLDLINAYRASWGQDSITMLELDSLLWTAGGSRDLEKPHLLCMTTAY